MSSPGEPSEAEIWFGKEHWRIPVPWYIFLSSICPGQSNPHLSLALPTSNQLIRVILDLRDIPGITGDISQQHDIVIAETTFLKKSKMSRLKRGKAAGIAFRQPLQKKIKCQGFV